MMLIKSHVFLAGRVACTGLLALACGLSLRPTPAQAQAPAAEAEAQPGTAPAPIPVAFEMLPSNHMVVRAKINGKGPFRLIFDLGAPVTLLSNRAGEASGVVKKNAPRSLLFAMRGEAEAATIEVGHFVVKDLPVIVLDHPALRALGGFLGRPLDGIIGYTFFARYKTIIDYQKREMTFEPVEFEVTNLMKDLPDRLAGPKVAKRVVLAPGALFGLTPGEPEGGLEAAGVPVSAVASGSAAEAAGLRPGDVITSLDGRWTTNVADMFAAAAGASAGHPVQAEILRDGKHQSLAITPRAGL